MASEISQEDRDRSLMSVFRQDEAFFQSSVIPLKNLIILSFMKIATKNRQGDVPLKSVKAVFIEATIRIPMKRLLWFRTSAKKFPPATTMRSPPLK